MMSDSDVYLPFGKLYREFWYIVLKYVVEKKWKLRARFSPTKENRVHQTETKTSGG